MVKRDMDTIRRFLDELPGGEVPGSDIDEYLESVRRRLFPQMVPKEGASAPPPIAESAGEVLEPSEAIASKEPPTHESEEEELMEELPAIEMVKKAEVIDIKPVDIEGEEVDFEIVAVEKEDEEVFVVEPLEKKKVKGKKVPTKRAKGRKVHGGGGVKKGKKKGKKPGSKGVKRGVKGAKPAPHGVTAKKVKKAPAKKVPVKTPKKAEGTEVKKAPAKKVKKVKKKAPPEEPVGMPAEDQLEGVDITTEGSDTWAETPEPTSKPETSEAVVGSEESVGDEASTEEALSRSESGETTEVAEAMEEEEGPTDGEGREEEGEGLDKDILDELFE